MVDRTHALHLPVRDVQYCLMTLDELLMMSLLTSAMIEGLTVSANASKSLSRHSIEDLETLGVTRNSRILQVKVHVFFLMSQKFQTFKFS